MMFSHFLWAFSGFMIGGIFLWVFHILKTRGFTFFWYHPIVAGVVLIIVLFIMETLFTSLEEWQMQADWWVTVFIGVPLALLAGLLLYRGITGGKA
ncbi:MAG: hypothetical protein RRY29_01590 [Desulfovibrionaceae bacterium]